MAYQQLTVEGTQVASAAGPMSDPFFDGNPDVLKSYAFDYDAIISFDTDLQWSNMLVSLCSPFCGCCPCVCLGFHVFTKPNVRDLANATHLAITRDGIRFVVDRHKAGCRCDFQDVGRVSKTVPFDKMTDCDLELPAGSSGPICCLVPNTLAHVHVDTASTTSGHELTLTGLLEPEKFKKDVWAMKRGEPVDGVDGTVAPLAVKMAREGSGSGSGGGFKAWFGGSKASDGEVMAVLREQSVLLSEILAEIKAARAAKA